MSDNLKQTPLNYIHQNLKAKMVPFAGFSMPVSYQSVKEEHSAVRNRCGIFDISHMMPVHIAGKGAAAFLEAVTTRTIAKLKSGRVQYNLLVDEKGFPVDDITILKLEDSFILVVNAANTDKVKTFFERVKSQKFSEVEINLPQDYVLLALQGPQSEENLKKSEYFSEYNFNDIDNLFFYEFMKLPFSVDDIPGFISRTGYTGEDGFEIFLPVDKGIALFENLIKNGVMPCGLAARDLLRLEVFYPLFGHEISSDHTAWVSPVTWLIHRKKEYLGRAALLQSENETEFIVTGFHLETPGVPREGYDVLCDQEVIGQVTSGAFSFLFDHGIGMAKIKKNRVDCDKLFIQIRNQPKKIKLMQESPYTGSIKKRPGQK